MGKIMEAIFCVLYLACTFFLGYKILANSKDKKDFFFYGLMTLVLVCGNSFHLVPRILSIFEHLCHLEIALGFGKLVTSITMTIFYVMLYCFYQMRYGKQSNVLTCSMLVLAVIRIVLCLLPQNNWFGAAPVIWGVYRNIPFAIMGLIVVCLFFKERNDEPFKWMWLAVTLSFAFYIPVVLWSDVHPMIGMLMMSKTIMYVWIVVMGLKAIEK